MRTCAVCPAKFADDALEDFCNHLRLHLPARSAYPNRPHDHHGLAIIAEETVIGPDTKIWAFAHISRGAVVGKNCMIGEGVHVGPGVKIGNGCRIQNGAQLFEGVTLEENVFIGPHVVFVNTKVPRVRDQKVTFSPTHVGRGSSIGANATILCGLSIGKFALIGAGAVVTRPVQAYECVVGNPANHHGWSCVCGEQLSHDYECASCGMRFRSTETGIERR